MSRIKEATQLDLICEELKQSIASASNEGVSIPEAEKLAAKTLTARLALADEIKTLSIDARMRKNVVKVVRSNLYLDLVSKAEKKPTETHLESVLNIDNEVRAEEAAYINAESELQRLETYSDVFKDSHIFFRTVAKGSFEG